MRKMNYSIAVPGWRGAILLAAALLVLMTPRAFAGTDMREITPPQTGGASCSDKDWSVELGAGGAWSNIRHGQPNQAYTLVPITTTLSLKVDDVSLDNYLGGVFRGYTEFFFQGEYYQIVHGPENHWAGFMAGPRYNFVQPGWKIVPFVEGGVGIGFADSNPQWGGFGQDFNFTFEVAAGARYDFDNCCFIRLGVYYQHMSNAGLSEPEFPNHPIDMLGPKLSFGYSF